MKKIFPICRFRKGKKAVNIKDFLKENCGTGDKKGRYKVVREDREKKKEATNREDNSGKGNKAVKEQENKKMLKDK